MSKKIIIKPKIEHQNEVAGFIQQAIEKNLPVEVMEKLFSLQEKYKAQKAKEEYVKSLANFQKEIPIIRKTKKVLNKDGQTLRYQYAPLDSIIEQIKKPLSNNNLSYSWEVENQPDLIKAIAKITHILGHSETSSFEIPVDKQAYMTTPQQYASALTFAKRYALCDALGISTADEDTDAIDVNTPPNVKSLKARIVFLLRSLGYKTDTKKEIEIAVKKISKLSLEEKNYNDIVERLEITLKENQEYENSKI